MKRALCFLTCAVLVVGCGEREQEKTAEDANARDTPAWKGTDNRYAAPGWQAGNQRAWETQLRTRGQQQNEYQKVN